MENMLRIMGAAVVLALAAAESKATVLVYEGFDYPAGNSTTGNLYGRNGGVGWSGAWYQDPGDAGSGNSNPYVVANSLAYAGVVTSGNKLYNNNDYGLRIAKRALASPLGDSSGTVWIGLLISNVNKPQFQNSTGGTALMVDWDFSGGWNVGIKVNGSALIAKKTVPQIGGQGILVLLRIDFAAGNDTVAFWVNPDLTNLGSPVGTTSSYDINVAGMRLGSFFGHLDEIRIATTQGEAVGQTVVPVIDNDGGVANVTRASATVYGRLISNGGQSTTVKLHWGTTDGGEDPNAWDTCSDLGIRGPGSVSTNLTGLVSGATYWYRYYAENGGGTDWAPETRSFVTAPGGGVPGAYEGFEYSEGQLLFPTTDAGSAGGGTTGGLDGGTGWNGAWFRDGGVGNPSSTPIVVTNRIGYAGVTTNGLAVRVREDWGFRPGKRLLANPLGDNSGAAWIGALVSNYTPIDFLGVNGVESIKLDWTGTTMSLKVLGTTRASLGVPMTRNHFLLMRIDFAIGVDSISVWLDPDLSNTSNLAAPTATWSGDDVHVTAVRVPRYYFVDEIRIGASLESAIGATPPPPDGGSVIIVR